LNKALMRFVIFLLLLLSLGNSAFATSTANFTPAKGGKLPVIDLQIPI